jgi:hypothetical protein
MLLFAIGALLLPATAGAITRGPIPPSVFKAVRTFWKTRTERVQAFNVSWCESRFDVWARNGQYENIFQMGLWERERFGWHHAGDSPVLAARAAYRYFVMTGRDWSPWTCGWAA